MFQHWKGMRRLGVLGFYNFANKSKFAVEILWQGWYNDVNKDKSNFIQRYTIPLEFGACP